MKKSFKVFVRRDYNQLNAIWNVLGLFISKNDLNETANSFLKAITLIHRFIL